MVLSRLHRQLHGFLLTAGHKQGGHPINIGLGHHPDIKGRRVGPQVGGGQFGGIFRSQAVLALEDVLHPVGDGVDLAVHAVADIVHGAAQVVVILRDPVQLGKQVEQGHNQRQHRRRTAQPDQFPPFERRLLGLGGQVAVHNLLDHLQLGLGELAGGGLRRGGGLLHPQQPAHGDRKNFAQGDKLVDLGQGGVRLPLINSLPGHPQLLSQPLLGQA